ncbi:MAG: Glucose-6-phosphate isomerase [Parcubacteria group bacterium Athens0416_74]|nr:MAG: Glucose-6-phosphate isomerase [Parcubacteria group bacterium Athens0416_74]
MTFEPYAARTHDKMRDVLMALETGTIGGEYIKTYGHYHIGDLDETYWFKEGAGVALLQKLADPSDPSVVAEFNAIQVKAGDEVYMPPGYGHLMINVGKTWLVMVDDSPVDGAEDSASMPGHADYTAVKAMQGFAYYVVEHDGAPALKKNPKYKEVRATDFGGLPVLN